MLVVTKKAGLLRVMAKHGKKRIFSRGKIAGTATSKVGRRP